jgi:protein phosphatase
MLRAHGVSHEGTVRRVNEDFLLLDVERGIFIVADGMGGHSAGEVASQMAVEAMEAFLLRSQVDDGFTWPFGLDASLSFNGNRLLTAIKLANRRVFKASESRPEYAGMGTTVVAVLVDGRDMTYASVGDSRIYSLAGDRFERLTRDDSWVATMLAEGQDPEDPGLQSHPLRHVLTKAVGTLQEAEVSVFARRLADGEILLLCSDGLHDCVTDAQMCAVLSGADGESPELCSRRLLRTALEAGARDNVTALVVAVPRD